MGCTQSMATAPAPIAASGLMPVAAVLAAADAANVPVTPSPMVGSTCAVCDLPAANGTHPVLYSANLVAKHHKGSKKHKKNQVMQAPPLLVAASVSTVVEEAGDDATGGTKYIVGHTVRSTPPIVDEEDQDHQRHHHHHHHHRHRHQHGNDDSDDDDVVYGAHTADAAANRRVSAASAGSATSASSNDTIVSLTSSVPSVPDPVVDLNPPPTVPLPAQRVAVNLLWW